ncbi:MAG TPA: CheR family methyltransferase, partial [Desulfobacterales bacterium]|nr:CheR family methyltransferase [Desulfobacterales bacterium]
RLEADNLETAELDRALTVTYSEFFRDPLAFAVLEEVVLPDLAQRAEAGGRRELRVWSAGCAGGEEACSVAILLHDLRAVRDSLVSFRIFATDASADELDRARRGVYGRAAVRKVRLEHMEAHFTPVADAWAVDVHLRNCVDYSRYDLLDERSTSPAPSIFGDFDLVLCCNLLFYYRRETREFIVAKVRQSLAPGGYLVTGTAEQAIVEHSGGFVTMTPPAAVYRKTGGRT